MDFSVEFISNLSPKLTYPFMLLDNKNVSFCILSNPPPPLWVVIYWRFPEAFSLNSTGEIT